MSPQHPCKNTASAAAQVLLDRSGGEADDVRRVAPARNTLDRMAGEVVDDRQRLSILPVQTEQADLRIDRPDANDILVARKRVGVADVGLPAVLQLEPAVLHDPVFAAAAGADPDGRQLLQAALTASTARCSTSSQTIP